MGWDLKVITEISLFQNQFRVFFVVVGNWLQSYLPHRIVWALNTLLHVKILAHGEL